MKQISIPISIYDIPRPWNLTSADQLEQEIDTLAPDPATISVAISVLERGLQAATEFPVPAIDKLPEEWREYWGLYTLELTNQMPELQDFNMAVIVALVRSRQTDAPPELVEAVTEFWLQSTIYNTTRSAMNWLEKALRKDTDPGRKERLVSITARYLLKVDITIAVLLISMVTIIAWQDVVPLLAQIENNPNLPERLREQAEHYHRWVRS
jgi:hypothetical protein